MNSDCQHFFVHSDFIKMGLLGKKNKNMRSDFFFKSDSEHIRRWCEVRFQSDFYRCVSVWMLWLLKSDFKWSFASLLTWHTMITWKTGDGNALGIHIVFKQSQPWLQHSASQYIPVFLVQWRSSAPRHLEIFPASVLKASSHMSTPTSLPKKPMQISWLCLDVQIWFIHLQLIVQTVWSDLIWFACSPNKKHL